MKTKELIRQLMEADPTGEDEVCVGNVDIHFVEPQPAYYDGPLQVLERDPNTRYYNIIGAKYRRSGRKLNIRPLSISDAISNSHADDDFIVDYSELSADDAARTKKAHDDLRTWHKNIRNEIELEHFLEWAKEKIRQTTVDVEDGRDIARHFFDKNLSAEDPLPEGGIPKGQSYVLTRNKQWDDTLEVLMDEGFLKIRKRCYV